MRNCLLAVVALSFFASANAHVSALDSGGSPEVAQQAAVTQTRSHANRPQIFYDIVTDGGATCNGDVQVVTRLVSIARGQRVLVVDQDTFAPGDVGKSISLSGVGPGGNTSFNSTIALYTSPTQVVLAANAQFTRIGYSLTFGFGTDDAGSFKSFNTWALANQGVNNQIVLTIPNGAICWFGTGQRYSIGLQNSFASGINDLIVEGHGATLSSIGGSGFWLGNRGICEVAVADRNGCSARIQSAPAGATQIELTAASLSAGYLSRFNVGKWIMIGGLDVQGLFLSAYGYPPNNTYFEWREITAVNTATGVVTLDRPLSNSYLSTWPNFNSSGAPDPGGPATIWVIGGAGNWNASLEYRGLVINQSDQTYGPARNLTLRNVTFQTGRGFTPTQNETFTAISTSWAGLDVEVDKFIGTITLDAVTAGIWAFQSNSVNAFNVSNSNFTKTLNGGGKQTTLTDTTINNWNPGTITYGTNQSGTTCRRCAVTTLFPNGPSSGAVSMSTSQTASFSMSSGIIKWSRSLSEYQRWASPIGGNFSIANAGSQAGPVNMFQVQSVTGDPWPAVDDQSATTNVTIPTSGNPNRLTTSTNIFTSGDVGKTIIVNGAGRRGTSFQLRTYITAVNAANDVSTLR